MESAQPKRIPLTHTVLVGTVGTGERCLTEELTWNSLRKRVNTFFHWNLYKIMNSEL